MDDTTNIQPLTYGRHEIGTLDIPDYLRFLLAIFDPDDTILFRPIETWTEGGSKRSDVKYDQIKYSAANPGLLLMTMQQLMKASERDKSNVFFGVCPRLGGKGHYELAWQIRKVNCLWADIDHTTVEEVLTLCTAATLPEPSIVVSSGNGAHLYWLLTEPIHITDAGTPPPVLTDWDRKNAKGVPYKYFVDEQGDEVSLESRHLHPALSSQAQHIQDILGGIAAKIGGDHTKDVTRLLRVPGTLNRKNERNGATPVPCELVSCDPDRRYSIQDFRSFGEAAPSKLQRAALAKVPLPRPCQPTKVKLEKFDDWVARSSLAEKGQRSSMDFGLCCFAIRNGIAKDEVWGRVQDVGKFSEGGERYFERTWQQAEDDVRTQKLAKLTEDNDPVAPARRSTNPIDAAIRSANDQDESADDGTIIVDASNMTVSGTLQQITNAMKKSKTAYHRAGQCVAIADDQLSTLLAPQELAGYLNQFVEFYFYCNEGGEFKPLPTAYANTWLNNPAQRKQLSEIKLFTHNPVYSPDWQLVAPGYDASSGIYYAGEVIQQLDGTKHLDKLLQDFCFRDQGDRANYLGVLLTIPLVTHFIGSKPAVLFNGNQPGLGKSILAQIIAILRDGHPVETATYNPNDEEYEKRLGSIVRRGVTTIITDNAKSQQRRASTIESGCLERAITDPILSFRLLGSSSDIRAENSHIFCITANAPDVSRDLVTRCVVVNLEHTGDPTKRAFSLTDPEGYALEHRRELLGELLGMIERWKQAGRPETNVESRFNKRGWGRIIGGILAHNNRQGFLCNAEASATEFDQTRREFGELVTVMHREARQRLTPADICALAVQKGLFVDELKDRSARSQVTRIGLLLTRYVAERFELDAERSAVLTRHIERKGCEYSLKVEDNSPSPPLVPNVQGVLPNLVLETFGSCNVVRDRDLPNLPNGAELVLPTTHVREEIADEKHTHEVGALAKGSAGSTGSAEPECNHLDPETWRVRNGEARCPACDRFMGRMSKPVLSN